MAYYGTSLAQHGISISQDVIHVSLLCFYKTGKLVNISKNKDFSILTKLDSDLFQYYCIMYLVIENTNIHSITATRNEEQFLL